MAKGKKYKVKVNSKCQWPRVKGKWQMVKVHGKGK